MISTIQNTLQELVELLEQLDKNAYTKPVETLHQATIGQHTRHIIELFVCLLQGYAAGKVNYDKRKRDKEIETLPAKAIELLQDIQASLDKTDKPILLEYALQETEIAIHSCYYRELLYNLEHCIHHQALIKVALWEMPHILIGENFGIAPSTIQYRTNVLTNA
jgi:uncharacterized damage-inducible protein DinB